MDAGSHIRWWLCVVMMFLGPWCTVHAAVEGTNTLCGIGAVLCVQDGGPMVRQIVAGGPASRDGRLQVGDRINGVAQGDGHFVNCGALTLDKVVDLIRGGKGTTVRLQVISGGQLKIINLVRAEIRLNQPMVNPVALANNETPAQLAADAARLADLLKQISAETRKIETATMAKEVDRVVQVTGLDGAGRAALETAAARAVDQGVKQSDANLADLCRAQFPGAAPRQLAAALNLANDPDATKGTPAGYASAWRMQRGISPTDMPAWQAGLAQALTAAQLTAWDAAEAKQKAHVESEIAGYLKGVADYGTDVEQHTIQPAINGIRETLNLSEDQMGRLGMVENFVAAEYGDAARAAAEKALLSMDDEERKEVIASQAYFNWLPPLKDNNWDKDLSKFFSPDEVKQIETANEDRRSERARAMGRLFLALMDERVALTAAQRQLLEPFAEELVSHADNLVSPNPNQAGDVSLPEIYAAAGLGPGDEIKAVLDPIQWRHWQEAAQLKDTPDNGADVGTTLQLPPADTASAPPPAAPAPEDVERAISNYLAEESDAARERIFTASLLRAEDAARVLHLPAEVAGRLETAARGSADAILCQWDAAVGQMVRSNLADATPETIKQRLASLQGYAFPQQGMDLDSAATSEGSVWDETVKEALTADQQQAWKVETDARQAYRSSAIAGWITCSFAQSFGLSQDQAAKLEPMVGDVVMKYARGIGSFFSNNSWYLESFYMYLPVAGIPDKDLQGLLSKDQLDRWNGSQMRGIANQYFAQIARMYPQMEAN